MRKSTIKLCLFAVLALLAVIGSSLVTEIRVWTITFAIIYGIYAVCLLWDFNVFDMLNDQNYGKKYISLTAAIASVVAGFIAVLIYITWESTILAIICAIVGLGVSIFASSIVHVKYAMSEIVEHVESVQRKFPKLYPKKDKIVNNNPRSDIGIIIGFFLGPLVGGIIISASYDVYDSNFWLFVGATIWTAIGSFISPILINRWTDKKVDGILQKAKQKDLEAQKTLWELADRSGHSENLYEELAECSNNYSQWAAEVDAIAEKVILDSIQYQDTKELYKSINEYADDNEYIKSAKETYFSQIISRIELEKRREWERKNELSDAQKDAIRRDIIYGSPTGGHSYMDPLVLPNLKSDNENQTVVHSEPQNSTSKNSTSSMRNTSGNTIGLIDGENIRDVYGNLTGSIRNGKFYDLYGNYIAEFRGNYLYDSNGNYQGELRGKNFYDTYGNLKYTLE